jgi:hypothetical protein
MVASQAYLGGPEYDFLTWCRTLEPENHQDLVESI